MNSVVNFVVSIWSGAVNAIRGVINGFLGGIANAVNSVVANVNRLIAAFNNLPGPDIAFVPFLNVPRFASGGYVDGPITALIGEAGPEYVIPARQMQAASSAYLSGARGAAVLQGGGGGAAPVINITTGPVMEFDGQRYVRIEDMERAMRQTADGVLGRLRTPAARIALGMR